MSDVTRRRDIAVIGRRGRDECITVGSCVVARTDTVGPGLRRDARATMLTEMLLVLTAAAAAACRGLYYQRLTVTTCVLRSTLTLTCALLHTQTLQVRL